MAGVTAGAATGEPVGAMCHGRTAGSQRQPENTMPKHRALMLARALVLSAAAGGMVSGCVGMDPDYAQRRPMSYSWSSSGGYGWGSADRYSAVGDETTVLIFAAVLAPFIIADRLDECLNTPR